MTTPPKNGPSTFAASAAIEGSSEKQTPSTAQAAPGAEHGEGEASVRRLAADPAGEAPCSDLYEGLNKSTATHHFKILVEAGAFRPVMVGPSRGHRLRRDALQEAAPGLLDALMEALARQD
ncbi:ArsR/SmtB family transcription factor [Streptomyces sp. enrichment culture]|uniref:ArsR/SmtB family transcription factor n=1 Tax=Streptomyces sp. enrichment culture TaxID=1795815 RepID=UPI003F559AB8